MVNKVDEGGFREEPIQKMGQEQKKFDNYDNKNKSTSNNLSIFGGVLLGLVVTNYDFKNSEILLDTPEYTVTAIIENSIADRLFYEKKEFKELNIYSKNKNKIIGTWDDKSGAQHPGISYVAPTISTPDTQICPGSNLLEGILFNCLDEIRTETINTNKYKIFYQTLDN